MTFLDGLNSPKLDFPHSRSCNEIIKFQQSQALTSHFESFWSVVTIDYIIEFKFIVSLIVWFNLQEQIINKN